MKSTIHIEPTGTIRAVYSDKLPLTKLGPMTVTRASNVEFNPASQQWEVRWAGEESLAFTHSSRDECIRWEVAELNERLAR